MAKGLEETLLALLADPGAAAAQADLAQAATLGRQELSFRQRAGAAAFRLRQARAEGADEAEIAELEARLKSRSARLTAARTQAAAADLKRPAPDAKLAQVFGRAVGSVEKSPVTAAVLTASSEVVARTVAAANGTFHFAVEGDLPEVRIQLSDAAGRVLSRSAVPVSVPAGTVLYLDISLADPEPEPGPVPAEAQMPDLVGQSEGVARALLSRLGIPDVAIVDKVAEGQPGIVIAQTPRAGEPLKSGAKVSLTVRRASGDAQGPRFLPSLVGRSLSEAEAALKALGLRANITRQSDAGPADQVLAQTPAEGTPLQHVKSVDLTVSQPREARPETVLVPDLVGKSRDLALELLKAADLKAEVTAVGDPAAPAGVIRQDPTPGTAVRFGVVVRFTVNTPPTAEPGLVAVPVLIGRREAEARKLLAEIGLKAKATSQVSTAPVGEVVGQDPAPGARVAAGSVLALTLSSGPATTAPRDTAALIRIMAENPRAAEAELTAARITALFRTGRITSLDAAKTLTEAAPKDIAARLRLASEAEAATFRAILIAAFEALG